jgi:hypothetical protein
VRFMLACTSDVCGCGSAATALVAHKRDLRLDTGCPLFLSGLWRARGKSCEPFFSPRLMPDRRRVYRRREASATPGWFRVGLFQHDGIYSHHEDKTWEPVYKYRAKRSGNRYVCSASGRKQ